MSLSGIAADAAPSSTFGPAGMKSVGKLGGASVLGATWLNLLRNSCAGPPVAVGGVGSSFAGGPGGGRGLHKRSSDQ